MKRLISLCLTFVLVLSLSACSCEIDWSKFDLTKPNFGLTEEKTTSDSDTTEVVSGDPVKNSVFSEETINYVVPENNSVVYNTWNTVSSDEFRDMAKTKLMEIADLVSDLSALKNELSDYSSVERLASDEKFSKLLNNIRAWSYGARTYSFDGLADQDVSILESFIILGTDTSEFGARFPALIITEDTKTIGAYEDLIISRIVELNDLISSDKTEQK